MTRHAQAEHNLGATFAGGKVNTALTRTGQQEARRRGKDIAENLSVDLIVCSALRRSQETAHLISRELGRAYGKEVPVIETVWLNEVNVGSCVGKTAKQFRQLHPEAAEHFYGGRIEQWSFPEGESYYGLVARVAQLKEFLRPYRKKKILLVGHSMFNSVLVYYFTKVRLRSFPHDSVVRLPIKFDHE